ncbi:hypothetical protein FA13DRAFT_1724054 [Coprinellus micaceus]|uniref:Uncharacterized protein n=1 Tax=Coprinellus micaceus TaxID=71717 RepID=A0A4Y7U1X9_COPMI|nr:hypothetical protein FA13DRAFT_1724054 [Coprinellus micaceus]
MPCILSSRTQWGSLWDYARRVFATVKSVRYDREGSKTRLITPSQRKFGVRRERYHETLRSELHQLLEPTRASELSDPIVRQMAGEVEREGRARF